MIWTIDELIDQLKEVRQSHGNIEVETNGFEGNSPIECIELREIDGKKTLLICEVS